MLGAEHLAANLKRLPQQRLRFRILAFGIVQQCQTSQAIGKLGGLRLVVALNGGGLLEQRLRVRVVGLAKVREAEIGHSYRRCGVGGSQQPPAQFESLAKDRNRIVVLRLVVIDNAETLHAVGDLALVWCEALTAQIERLLNQLRRLLIQSELVIDRRKEVNERGLHLFLAPQPSANALD